MYLLDYIPVSLACLFSIFVVIIYAGVVDHRANVYKCRVLRTTTKSLVSDTILIDPSNIKNWKIIIRLVAKIETITVDITASELINDLEVSILYHNKLKPDERLACLRLHRRLQYNVKQTLGSNPELVRVGFKKSQLIRWIKDGIRESRGV